MTDHAWALRYAPHIGFRGRALFEDTAGPDPVALIDFIADQGFAGFQDPMAAGRPSAEQARIGEAAAARGLAAGCFVYRFDPESPAPAAWGMLDADGRRQALAGLKAAIDVAGRLGSRHIAVLSARDTATPKWVQLAAMAENLRPAADVAAAAGLTLVLEATDAKRLPGMLLNHVADAVTVARMAAHPAVRLVFDTAHVQAMDGDLIANLRVAFDLVDLIQLADHPGRGEPGSGEINFETFLAEVHRLGFQGLCELEHLWVQPSRAAEAAGIETLRRLDAQAAARARAHATS